LIIFNLGAVIPRNNTYLKFGLLGSELLLPISIENNSFTYPFNLGFTSLILLNPFSKSFDFPEFCDKFAVSEQLK
tara:strand:- start:1053 stop:1277 length:225 start_codon:yes stop_codon:yes gene_type:complete